MTAYEVEKALDTMTKTMYNKSIKECSDKELFYSILQLTKGYSSMQKDIDGDKKVYYISAEFLIGKLLSNNLINLGLYDQLNEILEKNGKELANIEEQELEPSLGNGGLGRLAACFLDSIANLQLPGDGCGLNYHFGLFKQKFENLQQKTEKNDWIETQSWLNDTKKVYDIDFGYGKVKSHLYTIDVPGYNGGKNHLNLFDIETVDENIVYNGINFPQWDVSKNLTLFLYPDDSTKQGRLLRVYQQYFMVSSSAQMILEELKSKGHDLHKMNEHAKIQINDTHPSMVIPELIRLLTQNEGFSFDEAVDVVSKTCAYTNHTILAEALEKWPVDFLETACPQLVPIIRELDKRIKNKYGYNEKINIIDSQNRIHMAHMDIHYGYSVNGVAQLHTEILKKSELNEFYKLYPEKFNNKTNGITFRRWLLSCNKELSNLISSYIGNEYKKDATELEKLKALADNQELLNKLENVKHIKKVQLSEYLDKTSGIKLDPNSIFDIQAKRLHEYKRQQMNLLYIINKYQEIKAGKIPERPITFIFGAKAAPAYTIAQDIIHAILVMQETIKNDKDVSPYMNVVMLENYNVSLAEKVIPACDISEQISLASKEASGTGNMKFMLNGAVTLGTDDGANVEIHELVGDDNIYIFGKDSDTVIKLYEEGTYNPKEYYDKNNDIKNAIDFLTSDIAMKNGGNYERLNRLKNELLYKDWFKTLLDFEDYKITKDKAFKDYENRNEWKKKMLVNISQAGYFSSDRTISDYNKDIWKLK